MGVWVRLASENVVEWWQELARWWLRGAGVSVGRRGGVVGVSLSASVDTGSGDKLKARLVAVYKYL